MIVLAAWGVSRFLKNHKKAKYSFNNHTKYGKIKKENAVIVKEIISGAALSKSKLPTADYVANPYTGCTHKCVYCYAEFMKRFTNHYEEWGEFIDIKIFDKIRIPRDIKNKYVVISSVTDPYNHYEMKYEKTKQILEALKNADCHVGILTKSKNVLRDIGLFKQFKDIEVGMSMNTVDDNFRKLIEPGASAVEDRINALKTLRKNGIKNWLFMSPVFPYLSDYRKIIELTNGFVDYYGFENLNLRGGYKSRVLNLIKRRYGALYQDYVEIYKRGNKDYWHELEKEITRYCEDHRINYRMFFYHEKIRKK